MIDTKNISKVFLPASPTKANFILLSMAFPLRKYINPSKRAGKKTHIESFNGPIDIKFRFENSCANQVTTYVSQQQQ